MMNDGLKKKKTFDFQLVLSPWYTAVANIISFAYRFVYVLARQHITIPLAGLAFIMFGVYFDFIYKIFNLIKLSESSYQNI